MRSFDLFAIDLIVDNICSQLEQPHLHACALVSRSWYASFNRHLWRTFRIRQHCKLHILKEAHMLATLTKNCDYIQTIDTAFAGLVPLFQQFLGQTNILQSSDSALSTTPHATPPEATGRFSNCLQHLTGLYCRSTHIVENAPLRHNFAFVQNHPRLQVLELEHLKVTVANVHLLTRLIQHHPGLRRVRIEFFQEVPLSMYLQLLWTAAFHLESFALACSPYGDNDHWSMAVNDQRRDRTFHVQKLDLGRCQNAMLSGGGGKTLTALLRYCTNLKSLTLPDISSSLELQELSTVICDTLGDLRHLDARALHVSDEVLSELVCACGGGCGTGFSNSGIIPEMRSDPHSMTKARTGLESFFARGKGSVKDATVNSLRAYHAGTLTHLRLECCSGMDAIMIQSLLCSCLALQRFEMMMEHNARLSDYAENEPCLYEWSFNLTMGLRKPPTDLLKRNIRSRLALLESTIAICDDKGENEEDGEATKFPWVCLGLRVLSIRMAGTKSEVLPRVLCDQLCRLPELRHVRIESSWSNEKMIWDAGADSSVYGTFCRLGALKRICSIELRGYQRYLSKENAAMFAKEMQRLPIPTLLS